ncbi:MAG: serine/threonine protein kinase [Kofleriaceae bacterium]|nr:serine/threonine protein kinase [Kofleriaceae bacterium]
MTSGGPGDRGDGGDGGDGAPGPADERARALGHADTLASEPVSGGATPPSGPGASAAALAPPSQPGASGATGAIRGVGPGDRLGRYELGDELGAGGMASVYRARDVELRREVAVKVLFPHLARKPEITRRFQREARAAAVLEHPNILRVYDVGAQAGAPPFIVMELVRGASLREIGEARGPLLAELVAAIGALLCDALAVAHAAGVIHRDVKPGNVLLADDGRLLLADFGVAHLEDDDSLVTRSGALLGTPSFMAPEQALGNPVDGRSDLYAVGATLYQLATGALPYTGPTAKIVADAARGGATPALRRRPAVGAELSRLLERMMAPEPAGARRPRPRRRRRCGRWWSAAAASASRPTRCAPSPSTARAGRRRARRASSSAWSRARAPPGAAPCRRRWRWSTARWRWRPTTPARSPWPRSCRPEGRRRGLVVAVALAALGLAAAGAWMLTRDGGARGRGAAVTGDAGGAPSRGLDAAVDAALDARDLTAVDAGDLRVDLAAADAALARDAAVGRPRDAGASRPLADAAAAAGLVVDAAVPAVATADARPAPDAAPLAVSPARVTFAFDTWCELVVDDQPRGRADRELEVTLAPGRHRASCGQGPGLGGWSGTIEVAAGEVRRVEGTLLAPVEVVIDLGGGVRIGGQVVRRGATIVLRPGRYRVELLDGSRVRSAGYVNIPRLPRCTLRETPSLDCYRT